MPRRRAHPCLALPFMCALSAAAFAEGVSDSIAPPKSEALIRKQLFDSTDDLIDTIKSLSQQNFEALKSQGVSDPGADAQKTGTLKTNLVKLRQGDVLSTEEVKALKIGLSDSGWSQLSTGYTALDTQRREFCAKQKQSPQIQTIGWLPTLSFEPKDANRTALDERSLRIQIEGRDLSPTCARVDIQVFGTVPVSRSGSKPSWESISENKGTHDYYVNYPKEERPNSINVVLLEPYLDRLKTGDKVTVAVQVSPKYRKEDDATHPFFARRTFTLYTTNDYRTKVLDRRIQPENFSAYPLPQKDIEQLFGPMVRDQYYVVRLQLRNTDSKAKLVSTGMIRASGTAMVWTEDDDKHPRYAMPLTVVPHSLPQIYAAMNDEETDRARSWIFRSLEFAGALATGVQTVVSLGTQAVQGVGMFTGLVIPEGKKLWPDRWPGYKSNLVNFAMPDLTKIPANSVSDNRFLFFPKKEIYGIVSNPELLTLPDPDNPSSLARRTLKKDSLPQASLIEVSFDDMDIQFEEVTSESKDSGTKTPTVTPADLQRQADNQIKQLNDEVNPWVTNNAKIPAAMFSGLSTADLTSIQKSKTDALNKLSVIPTDAQVAMTSTLADIDKLTQALSGTQGSAFYADLYAGKYGYTAMLQTKTDITLLTNKINAGNSDSTTQTQLEELSSQVTISANLLSYYKEAAKTASTIKADLASMATAMTTAATTLDADTAAKVKTYQASIQSQIEALKKDKPGQASLF